MGTKPLRLVRRQRHATCRFREGDKIVGPRARPTHVEQRAHVNRLPEPRGSNGCDGARADPPLDHAIPDHNVDVAGGQQSCLRPAQGNRGFRSGLCDAPEPSRSVDKRPTERQATKRTAVNELHQLKDGCARFPGKIAALHRLGPAAFSVGRLRRRLQSAKFLDLTAYGAQRRWLVPSPLFARARP